MSVYVTPPSVTLAASDDDDRLRPVVALVEELVGKRPSPSTCWRWARRGTQRAGRLPCVKVLGTLHTTRADLLKWLNAGTTIPPREVASDEDLRAAGLLD